MIIVPTEKRFDWQHTPVVLFALVLINLLVFFLYQSGDNAKFERAAVAYEEYELFDTEWPVYRDYLLAQGEESLATNYEALVEQEFGHQVSAALLLDFEFARYLDANGRSVLTGTAYDSWYYGREAVNEIIGSISFLSAGLIPNNLRAFSLISYQFLHGDLMHLLGNLFFLLVCGFAVEAAIGHFRFLLFYLITGVVGGLFHVALNMDSAVSLVGASAAVSGVMAMYLGVFRFRKIEFFYWFFVFVGYFRAPALLILPIYIGKELFNYYSNGESNVAFIAHAGGFLSGSLLMAASLLINPKLVNEEYVEEDQQRNPFQEKLAKVYRYIETFQFRPALKAVQSMIEEYGLHFELAFLRCNLLKANSSERYHDALLEIFRTEGPMPRHINQQAALWRNNLQLREELDDETLVKLGLRFATVEHFASAEEVIKLLQIRQCEHPRMGVLARKLAQVANALNQSGKQENYQQLAEKSLAR